MSKDGMGGYDLPSEDDREKPRSSKASSEHATVREKYFVNTYLANELQGNLNALVSQGYVIDHIFPLPEDQVRNYQSAYVVVAKDVREVRPGEITITRDQLSTAMRLECPEAWGEGRDENLWRALLPEGTKAP